MRQSTEMGLDPTQEHKGGKNTERTRGRQNKQKPRAGLHEKHNLRI